MHSKVSASFIQPANPHPPAFCPDDMRPTLDKILHHEFLSVSRKVKSFLLYEYTPY